MSISSRKRNPIVFATGNQKKADYLSAYLGIPVDHKKIDLDELQSLDLKKIVEHKVRQAFKKVKKPVIVEDISLEFAALDGLPGPFIKFFVEKDLFEPMCRMVDGKSRRAVGRCVIGYYDGVQCTLFEGKLHGEIALKPKGDNGFGWDKIFIPAGYKTTRAELSEAEYKKVYLKIRPLAALKKFLMQSVL